MNFFFDVIAELLRTNKSASSDNSTRGNALISEIMGNGNHEFVV